MFKLKPVLNYLGYDDTSLNARQTSRCPTCSPPTGSNDAAPADSCPGGSDFVANVGPLNYSGGLLSPSQMTGMIFADGLIWIKRMSGGLGLRYLDGYHPLTGVLVRTIDVYTLAGSKYIGRSDMAVDSAGNIWVGYINDAGALTEYRVFIFNPTTGALVSSLFQEVTVYSFDELIPDTTRGFMWAYSTAAGGKRVAIDMATHLEDHSVPLNLNYAVALDTDKNEMWGCRSTGYGLVVYNATTGVLSQTLGAPMMSVSNCRYIPEKKTILMTGTQGTEVWSTETYTRVGYILDVDLDPSYDVGVHLTAYNPASDEYFGVGFNYLTTLGDHIAFIDADTLTINTPYDSVATISSNGTATVLAGACACYAICEGPATDDYLVRITR